MRTWKKLAVLAVFAAVIVIDSFQIMTIPSCVEGDSVSKAALGSWPTIKWMKAQYNDQGELTGCSGSGYTCMAMIFESSTVHITLDGVRVEK